MTIRWFLSPIATYMDGEIARNCPKVGLRRTVLKARFNNLLHKNELLPVEENKYPHTEWGCVFSKDRTMALVRMDIGSAEAISPEDIDHELTTPAEWQALFTEYPEFYGCWADLPVGA